MVFTLAYEDDDIPGRFQELHLRMEADEEAAQQNFGTTSLNL